MNLKKIKSLCNKPLPPLTFTGDVILFCLMALAFRMVGLGEIPIWIDEVYSVWVANLHAYPSLEIFQPVAHTVEEGFQQAIAWQGFIWEGENFSALLTLLEHNVHLPLYYLLLNPWLGAVGNSLFNLRLFSVLWNVLSLIPVMLLAKAMTEYVAQQNTSKQASKWVLFAGVLGALSPGMIYFAQEGRMYGLLLFVVSASLLMLWRLLFATSSCRKKDIVLYTIFVLMGVMTHYVFYFVLLGHAGIALLVTYLGLNQNNKEDSLLTRFATLLKTFALPVIAVLTAVVLWYPVYQAQQSFTASNYHFAKSVMGPLRYLEGFVWQPVILLAGKNSLHRALYIVMTVAMMILGLLRFWKYKHVKKTLYNVLPTYGFLVLSMLIPVTVQVAYDLVSGTHLSIIDRYLIYMMPSLILILSLLMTNAYCSEAYQSSQCLAVTVLLPMILVLGLLAPIPRSPLWVHQHKKDFRASAMWLANQLQPGDLIVANGNYGVEHLVTSYLRETHPNQPVYFWMKTHLGEPVPLMTQSTFLAYPRVWFFFYRSNEKRGLKTIKKRLRNTYEKETEQVDPAGLIRLFEKPIKQPENPVG